MKRVTTSGLFFLILTLVAPSFGQEHTGVITDAETGDPLVGANAAVQGTSIGASTGVDGRFSFQYTNNEDYTLVVSFVGYRTVERVLSPGDNTSNLNFSLETDLLGTDEIVVTGVGSRGQPRSIIDSAVPIDVVKSEDIVKQGGTDLPDLIRNIVPSYNVNTQPISDAATVVRPANLRGLGPDHTLVLVNGKRRHRASVIYWVGNGVADGAQGPDISPIPSIALRQVEVLRDGASAQYGSDAIAGVMNFQLKDSYRGGSLEFKPGIFQEGDGFTYAVAGNIGLGSERAWANLSLEYGNADETDRAIQRNDAIGLIAAGNTHVTNPAQKWGQPIIRNDVKFFANYGASLTDNISLYGHGNLATKEVEGGFYYRNPNTRDAVFSGDKGQTLLVGDLDGVNMGGDCPNVAVTNSAPDADALAQVFNDDNCFTFQEQQGSFPGRPGGFTPRFGANTQDVSFLVGVKGTNPSPQPTFTWDLSASYGQHHSDFFIFNTVNASLGPDSPTSFDPGDYIQTDTNVNLDFTKLVNKQLFLAAGLEYRTETFEIVAGDEASWAIGPLATQGFSSASNGFNGFPPLSAGTFDRSNASVYTEAEYYPLENWLLGAALRHEDFDDFGTTTNYKLATNYGFSDDLKIRSSYNTGFRAPTPGQQNAFNVSTQFDVALGDLVNNGTIPSSNPVARLVGSKSLEAEKSKNFTAGFVLDLPGFEVTIDYFEIRVRDRLALSQDFSLQESLTEEQIILFEHGADGVGGDGEVPYVRNLANFRYFINDFETRTNGVDIVITTPTGPAGELIFAYNLTDTEVTKHNPKTLEAGRIKELQESIPRNRANLTWIQTLTDNLGVLGRWSYYSSWWDDDDLRTYGSEFKLFDLESSYSLANGLIVSVGAQNILNAYPDENPGGADGAGNQYSQFSPFGFGGTFWYGKFNYSF